MLCRPPYNDDHRKIDDLQSVAERAKGGYMATPPWKLEINLGVAESTLYSMSTFWGVLGLCQNPKDFFTRAYKGVWTSLRRNNACCASDWVRPCG